MKTFKKIQFLLLLSTGVMLTLLSSCSKKNEPTATINVTSVNSAKSGDVKGNGGTATKTQAFTNPNTTAGWDMSMNSTSGSFRMVIKDAAGTVMIDKILTAGVGVQSADGTSPAGIAGQWNVTITLSNFNGSGDYSFR